ncbi:zinc-binding dehydrogenase [bacterium]|nr:zinc-binding dehydrogenase [bacterium]
MRAAILYGPRDFRIEVRPRPRIEKEECLVRVRACGVCHSELHQWEVKEPGLEYPRFIGHEVSGEIIDAGASVRDFRKGDRVAVWTESGGYAEEVAVRFDRIFPVHPDIPFAQALAEPISCATNGVIRSRIGLNDSVVLVGAGFMGLILLQEIRAAGAGRIIAVDVRDTMLELARRLGADAVVNPLRGDAVAAVEKELGGGKADVVFEAGGMQETLDLAADLCRMEGKLVLFGYHPGPRQIKHFGYWNWMAFDIVNAHFRELNVILNGARIGMALLNAGRIDMGPLITHRFPLEAVNEAFAASREKPVGFVKSVIVFD